MMNTPLSALLLLLLGLANFAQAQEAPRYNLIAICTDDQAQWAVGAYGNPEVKTPNIDRIAAEGALFLNAFCNTPVCSPSRATYMSGLYPTEVGITDWIAPNEAAAGLGLGAATWPQVLQKAGYATAMIGKWHLGEKPEFHPTQKGFDSFTGFLAGGNKPMDPTLEIEGETLQVEGPLPDILTVDAMEWITRQKEKPFAVCLHFRAPHLPYGPVPEVDSAPFKDLDPQFIPNLKGLDAEWVKQEHRGYYASIASVDRNVGRLLEFLQAEGLAENTIVMFTSDHGYNIGRHYVSTKGNGGWLGGGKIPGAPTRPNMWDTSLRVPLVVRWPGVVKPGTKVEMMFSFVNMYRTVLGMLNVPVPADSKARGMDYAPLLKGQAFQADPFMFGQYDLHNNGLAYLRMVRNDRYKLVKHVHENQQDEFYDLQADPEEAKNLWKAGPGKKRAPEIAAEIEKLEAELKKRMEEVNDPLLKDAY